MYNYSYYQCVIHLWFCTVDYYSYIGFYNNGRMRAKGFLQQQPTKTKFKSDHVLCCKYSDWLFITTVIKSIANHYMCSITSDLTSVLWADVRTSETAVIDSVDSSIA